MWARVRLSSAWYAGAWQGSWSCMHSMSSNRYRSRIWMKALGLRWGTFPSPTSLKWPPHATPSQERDAGACVYDWRAPCLISSFTQSPHFQTPAAELPRQSQGFRGWLLHSFFPAFSLPYLATIDLASIIIILPFWACYTHGHCHIRCGLLKQGLFIHPNVLET